MASTFVGLDVRLQHKSGTQILGRVRNIDVSTQLLLLENVTVIAPHGQEIRLPTYQLPGSDIVDIELATQPPGHSLASARPLSDPSPPLHPSPAQALAAASDRQDRSSVTAPTQSNQTFVDPAILSFSVGKPDGLAQPAPISGQAPPLARSATSGGTADGAGPSFPHSAESSLNSSSAVLSSSLQRKAASPAMARSKTGSSRGLYASPSRPRQSRSRNPSSGGKSTGSPRRSRDPGLDRRLNGPRYDENQWADSDVGEYTDDFDFQSSLQLFDKRSIFAEIASSDSKPADHLLVNLNRRKPQSANIGQIKLGIREMALSGDETGNDAEVESTENEEDGIIDDQYHGPLKRTRFRTYFGTPVPSVTPFEMAEIERITVTETGPNEEQLIENGGRGAAMLVLQALGGSRRIKPGNHNSPPIVAVLAGNNRIGAYGLAAARHLSNHECQVIVCLIGSDEDLSNTVSYQRKIFIPTGGSIVRSARELPGLSQPVDLIIDAIFGAQQGLLDLNESERFMVSGMIKWANDNKAPTLSLDISSGINGVVGQPTAPTSYIHSTWTLAMGLPKTGTPSREISGELLLADIGIPKIVFQKLSRSNGPAAVPLNISAGASPVGTLGARSIGKIRYIPPFGDKFVVGLEEIPLGEE
ncbi:YjeF N-terminal domain-containing protein [Polychytrium aggregatum]|uniref:YjeF N-terminal domain-containing protein n=1 Tax=Polychytrium aggregatum TaxID=110093 RepID=UPI0022FE4F67|nr:YjeF N-terminal domain-containing protein [Polychytrium aggregatum]KAI9209626.1 YjeF N-terminal domain-containing protein [Polychytrium aggregatum]